MEAITIYDHNRNLEEFFDNKELKRKVIVYTFDFKTIIKNSEPCQENEITLNIEDRNYDYTILPNGETTKDRIIIYNVSENGLYLFGEVCSYPVPEFGVNDMTMLHIGYSF